MSSATVTSKGQITLPSELREEFGLKPGDKIEFYKDAAGGLHVRMINLSPQAFLDSLPPLPRATSKESEDELADALEEDDARIRKEYHAARQEAA
jgi:antitoxin PrlF